MKKILVILGPTATGKTDLALSLAKKFNGELISADSRQVYVGLDIGTGKMPSSGKWKIEDGRWIVNEISIHMYDVVDPKDQYNVAQYVKDAKKIIEAISKRGKLPILVGGTGFYIRALISGFNNLSIPVNKSLREKLEKLSLKELQDKLKVISPTRWEKLNNSDKQNPRRLPRSIELGSMYPYMDPSKNTDGLYKTFQVLKIGLNAPRDVLYKNVDLAILSRIKKGMTLEAKKLKGKGLNLNRMRQLGLEYGILADFLEGRISEENLIKILQRKTHGFVRQQLTFFKKEKDVEWFDISSKNFFGQVENLVTKWYDPT